MMANKVTVESEMAKNKELNMDDVANVKSWCSNQIYGTFITDIEIVNFLHASWYNVEKAKETIDAYYKIRSYAWEIFSDRDPRSSFISETFDTMSFTILPKMTVSENRIIYTGLNQFDAHLYNYADVVKCLHMVVDCHLLEYGTEKGFVFVFDMAGVTFAHIKKMHINVMKNIIFYIQSAIPIRIEEIHFINMDSVSGKIMNLLKPFVETSIYKKMNFHTVGNDSLYNYIPRNILPVDLGGTDGSIENLRDKTYKRLVENHEYFINEEKNRIPKNLLLSNTPFEHDYFENDFKSIINID